MKPKASVALSERAIILALKKRYAPPAWAFLPQVRNGTGYVRPVVRTADAIAMSVWPSRGLEVWGFEVKSSRSDWLRELQDPAKASEIGAYCDRWAVVVGREDIVQPGELPPTWGLMVPRGEDGLVFKVEAPLNARAEPFSRAFMASLFRSALEYVAPPEEIEERLRTEYDRGRKAGVESQASALSAAKFECEMAMRGAARFRELTGVKMDSWEIERVAKAVKLVLTGGLDNIRASFDNIRSIAESVLQKVPAREEFELAVGLPVGNEGGSNNVD